jgi:hypothetical protein
VNFTHIHITQTSRILKEVASSCIKYPCAKLSQFPLKESFGKVHKYY